MGWRFRRSVRILPGIRLNLSRSGVSASVGVKGAHITVGHGKVRETVGLPGTGISYTGTHSTHQPHGEAPSEEQATAVTEPLSEGDASRGWLWIIVLVVIIAGALMWFRS
jgi:Protein of unknown function (DUF4236)